MKNELNENGQSINRPAQLIPDIPLHRTKLAVVCSSMTWLLLCSPNTLPWSSRGEIRKKAADFSSTKPTKHNLGDIGLSLVFHRLITQYAFFKYL
jgi:hypothetical protein